MHSSCMVRTDPGAGSTTEITMRGIALLALLALAVACGKEEAPPAKGDTGMNTPDMSKTADDMKKSADSAAQMRTVKLSIDGMS